MEFGSQKTTATGAMPLTEVSLKMLQILSAGKLGSYPVVFHSVLNGASLISSTALIFNSQKGH